jgi:hypothetical protein
MQLGLARTMIAQIIYWMNKRVFFIQHYMQTLETSAIYTYFVLNQNTMASPASTQLAAA